MSTDTSGLGFQDRRHVSAHDIGRLIEQNQGIANTIQSLVSTVNNHETRIAVLEVRATVSSDEISDIKKTGQEMLHVLAEHTQQEDRDRRRLLLFVIATLLSVLGGIGTFLMQRVLG